MTQQVGRLYQSNPFSTRFVRPGAIEYLFLGDTSTAQLIDTLASNGWHGAIIGPHGSGKTTLLTTLLPRLEERGLQPHLISLHDCQRWMLRGWQKSLALPLSPSPWNSSSCQTSRSSTGAIDSRPLLVIDGYEQLNSWSRWRVGRCCRRNGWGLLVTAHSSVSLPTLFTTHPSVAIAQTICERLLPDDVTILTPDDVADAFAKAMGNVRETLFDLYDRYERRSMALRKPNRASL